MTLSEAQNEISNMKFSLYDARELLRNAQSEEAATILGDLILKLQALRNNLSTLTA